MPDLARRYAGAGSAAFGHYFDSTGAAVPTVSIKATQSERQVVFQAESDLEGGDLFPKPPIGSYQVRAERQGFRTAVRDGITLTTSAGISLNLVLEAGSPTEQVTVSADASRVSTEPATIQQLVDTRRIVELPLNGRDVYQLARLTPGVGQSGVNTGGGRSGSQNSGMANVRVDGALNADNVFQQLLPSPSPDAAQEFTIQTSVPSAKYGYASGVIESSTKSGTNMVHGSLYEFLGNERWWAHRPMWPEIYVPIETRPEFPYSRWHILPKEGMEACRLAPIEIDRCDPFGAVGVRNRIPARSG